jgi:integrase
MGRPVKKQRGIYERPKGSGIWWICYYDQNGLRHREKVGMRSAAIGVYQQRKTEVRQDKFKPEEVRNKHRRASVTEIINDYLEASEKKHRSIGDTRIRAAWWKKLYGDRAARSITALDVELSRKLLSEGKSSSNNGKKILPGEGRAVSTVNRYLAVLRAAYSLAVRSGKADKNPVKQVKMLKEENERCRCLTAEEEERLLKVMPEEWQPLFIIALNTGLRKSELLDLLWADVDFQRRLIQVRKSKSKKKRFVPMRPVVFDLLKSLPRMINNEYVFYGHLKGQRLKDVPKEWEIWLAEAGVKDFRWHDLRHTFASRLVSSGVPLYAVQVLLGHSSIKVTERYSHLEPDYLGQAINIPGLAVQLPPEQPPARTEVA